MNIPVTNDGDLVDGYPNEDLHWAVSLVEDWLLHASHETLDELADFAYGPAYRGHDGHDQLRWIIELLGATAARLRPAPPPTAPPATAPPAGAPPAGADPTTSRRRGG
jgi:hypothetical protein